MADVTPAQLRRGYGPIYRWLSRCGMQLETTEKLVLLNLLERQGQNASAWPVQNTICEDTGLGERTVRRALRALEDHGFIATGRSAPGAQNVYEVVLNTILDAAEHRTNGDSLSGRPPASVAAPSGHSGRPLRPHDPDPPASVAGSLSLVEDTQRSLPMEATNRNAGGGVLNDFLRDIGVINPDEWRAEYYIGDLYRARDRLLESCPPFDVFDDDSPFAQRARKFSAIEEEGRPASLMERCAAVGIHNPAGLFRSWLEVRKPKDKEARRG